MKRIKVNPASKGLPNGGQFRLRAEARDGPSGNNLVLPVNVPHRRIHDPSRMTLQAESRDGPLRERLFRKENLSARNLSQSVKPPGFDLYRSMALFRSRISCLETCLKRAGMAELCLDVMRKVPRDRIDKILFETNARSTLEGMVRTPLEGITKMPCDTRIRGKTRFRRRKIRWIDRPSGPVMGEVHPEEIKTQNSKLKNRIEYSQYSIIDNYQNRKSQIVNRKS